MNSVSRTALVGAIVAVIMSACGGGSDSSADTSASSADSSNALNTSNGSGTPPEPEGGTTTSSGSGATTLPVESSSSGATNGSSTSGGSSGASPPHTPATSFELTVVKAGGGTGLVESSIGGINCGAVCTDDYEHGSTVTLTAATAEGSLFTGWSGACSGTGTCTVTMTQAHSVTANFTNDPAWAGFTLTVTKAGTGQGTVQTTSGTNIDCGANCSTQLKSGTAVSLTATPDADSTFAGWSGPCTGTDACSVTMDSAQNITAEFTASPQALAATQTGIYPDLTRAPVGAFVTVYGIDSATASWPVILHGNGKTVVKVPASAPALTVGGQSIPVTVNAGRVILATPTTLAAKFRAIRPGDVIYLRAGTYNGKYDDNGWNESNFVLFTSGTAALPMAVVAYPGEAVTIDNTAASRPNFYLGDAGSGRKGSYFTIAGLNLKAKYATIYGGGNTSNSSTPESGAAYVRVIGCTHTLTDSTLNTGTGIIALQGDGWKILGNTLNDPVNRAIINNNHAIYIQNGADDVEVAYNKLINLRMGHTIQIHQDGTPMLYSNVRIHDNLIQNTTRSDARGMTVSNVDNASTVIIERNTIRNVGQGFGGITVYRGRVQVRNNVIENVDGPGIQANGNAGGTRTITESGNTFTNVANGPFSAVNGARLSDFVHQ